jgi:hypothetical protein
MPRPASGRGDRSRHRTFELGAASSACLQPIRSPLAFAPYVLRLWYFCNLLFPFGCWVAFSFNQRGCLRATCWIPASTEDLFFEWNSTWSIQPHEVHHIWEQVITTRHQYLWTRSSINVRSISVWHAHQCYYSSIIDKPAAVIYPHQIYNVTPIHGTKPSTKIDLMYSHPCYYSSINDKPATVRWYIHIRYTTSRRSMASNHLA